ncbi:MAG: hypothetical protein RL341_2460 [Pseudomonadota bacterium]
MKPGFTKISAFAAHAMGAVIFLAPLELKQPERGSLAFLHIGWHSAAADDGDGGDDGDDGDGGSGSGASADGGGENVTMPFAGNHIRNEIVAMGLSAAQVAQLKTQGFAVQAQRGSASLGGEVLRLQVPRSLSADAAATQVESLQRGSTADLNHLYRPGQACSGEQCIALTSIGWPKQTGKCSRRVLIGLIDTRVDATHESLRGQKVQVIDVHRQDKRASGAAHGTGVAALLVGSPGSKTPGLLPQAELIAVDGFHRALVADDRMDVYDLVAAMDALLEKRVAVINLSFAGPANELVERSVRTALKRGVVLVAAAGNDGPSAGPRYPAAYAGVIAATAVRADNQIYRRAVTGKHIAFAAPGVDVWTAAPGSATGARKTGTSFAAPYVTAAAALAIAAGRASGAEQVRKQLASKAKDLGSPGVDPVYGHGLIQTQHLCPA